MLQQSNSTLQICDTKEMKTFFRESCVSAFGVLMALYLLHTYILLCTIATFQKAGTCLEAQQSMAKQPIKGCVSNHSRTCGESVSEKSE